MGTRTSIWAAAAALVTVLGSMLAVGPVAAGASSPADQGVTAKTIAVGLPYVNFAALQSLGVTINDGSFPDAYNAVIAGINAKGGINGRKLVLALRRDESLGARRCDVVVHPAHRGRPRLHRHLAGVPGLLPADLRHAGDRRVAARERCRPARRPTSRSSRPTRTSIRCSSPPSRRPGDFKGKKVAIFYGADSDAPEVKVVQADLKKLGVPVVLTRRGQRAGNRRRRIRPGGPVHRPALPERRGERGGRRRRLGLDDLASGAARQPEHLQAHVHRHQRVVAHLVRGVDQGRQPVPGHTCSRPPRRPPSTSSGRTRRSRSAPPSVHKAYPSDTITPPVNPTSPGSGATAPTRPTNRCSRPASTWRCSTTSPTRPART